MIVKISGGLGNQMFQYAFGRALSIHFGVQLQLDISFYGKQSLRSYELDLFSLKSDIISAEKIYKWVLDDSLISKFRRKYRFLSHKKYMKEGWYQQDPCFIDGYYDGYWQNADYFDSIKDILRQDFRLRESLSNGCQNYLNAIDSSNAISLHVRRGDYANDAKTNAVHGMCSKRYYQRSIDYVSEYVKDLHYFVFSDEIEWVKDNLDLQGNVTYIEDELLASSAESITLMSACDHNIIANSSFSWWGAWLNDNPDKIVICPEKWFSVKREKEPPLENWIRL